LIENPRDTITILVASVMIWTDPRSTTASISELAALSREFAAIIIVLVSKVNFSPCAFLHWLPLQQRIQYKIAVITRKALSTSVPPYIDELLQRQVTTRSLRSTDAPRLSVPWHALRQPRERSAAAWRRLRTSRTHYLMTFVTPVRCIMTSRSPEPDSTLTKSTCVQLQIRTWSLSLCHFITC